MQGIMDKRVQVCQTAQDFPIDSCACHIFYEHWVQMQLVISLVPLDSASLIRLVGSLKAS